MTAHGLIDTTEMYLRTIFELEEEGIVPLRARIAERLHQSGPTVSQTVARMERDGLVRVEGDRHLAMTPQGQQQAVRVMRKHRLAECLLVNVIGLAWEDVHIEACRWEHVMSDAVEARLVDLLGHPKQCPHGNPIPGLTEEDAGEDAAKERGSTMSDAAGKNSAAVITRISEQLQSDPAVMLKLKQVGIQPGREVKLTVRKDGVRVTGDEEADFPREITDHIFVGVTGGQSPGLQGVGGLPGR